jgi:tetratricopeptide (TPR) repeat protein
MPPTAPRVFISYSHDDPAHCDRVLALAQQLRRDGIHAELDQFHDQELLHWPRWCEEQMRPENADAILCICTEQYQRRVEGRVAADVGKGVFWEATLIYNELYDGKGNARCVPLLSHTAAETCIPSVLKNLTRFRLGAFGLHDDGYCKLYRLLTRQPGVVAEDVGALASLPPLAEGERVTDFTQLIAASLQRIEAQQHAHGDALHDVKHLIANPKIIAARLREEIETRFQRDREAAHRTNADWQAIRQLEKHRDTALAQVDDIVRFIEQGLAGHPDPIFREAAALLERQGSDAALAYLHSHRATIQANADKAAQHAEAAQEKLQESLRPWLLEAELHQSRQEWDAALQRLQAVAGKAPHWWEARTRLGEQLRGLARFAEAEPHQRAAVALAVEMEDQAVALNNLALLLQATNRLAEAEPLMRRALVIAQQICGSAHPQVAIHLNNLAQLLQATNRLSEAEPLLRRALVIDEQSYGSEHSEVAVDLSNLALLLQSTERLMEAEPLMRRALSIDEQSYGSEHPAVARDLNNLAQLLQATNRLSEAEPLMQRALDIAEKSVGSEHPNVATHLNNLAQLLQATSRPSEAEPLMRRALIIDEQSYGPGHPDVARDLNNLAALLQATNRLAEAEPLMRRALAIDGQSFGPEHPAVARDLNNLALVLQVTNRPAEAEPLMRRALAIAEQSHGPGHPEVAGHLSNLAGLLQNANRLAEAEPLLRQALVIDEQSYGLEHSAVARDLNNLGQLLQDTGRLTEAEPLMRRALAIFLRHAHRNGHEHPHRQTVEDNYRKLLFETGLDVAQVDQSIAEMVAEARHRP